MRYLCAECGTVDVNVDECPRCHGPVFPDSAAGLEMARNYRELGQLRPRSWNPGLVAIAAVGLSYPLWSALFLTLSSGNDNPLDLARWPAVLTGGLAWLAAEAVRRRRTTAAEQRLEDRLGVPRLSLGRLLRSPSFALVLVSVLVWVYSIGSPEAVWRLAWNPAECWRGERLWTLVTGPFTHADLSHLGWNVLMLLVVADEVEARLSWPAYVGLFVLGAVAGELTTAAVATGPIIMLGMSGGVMAIFGAHVAVSPWQLCYAPYVPTKLPAILSLPLLALLVVLHDAVVSGTSSWAAHLGGFVAGLLLALALRAVHLAHPDPTPAPEALI